MNTASDFIAQYTNRQEFRHVDSPLYDEDGNLGMYDPYVHALSIYS